MDFCRLAIDLNLQGKAGPVPSRLELQKEARHTLENRPFTPDEVELGALSIILCRILVRPHLPSGRGCGIDSLSPKPMSFRHE